MKLTLKVFAAVTAVLLLLAAPQQGWAQSLRPYEPLNPAKAQTLTTSPLTIISNGKTHKFTVELAETDEQRDIGLMHRTQLAPDHGMLFDFHDAQIVRFWMRNTFIPLDMLFIRGDGTVVSVFKNVRPHDEAPVGPNARVQAVLELAAGTADRLDLKMGDKVTHTIFKTAAK